MFSCTSVMAHCLMKYNKLLIIFLCFEAGPLSQKRLNISGCRKQTKIIDRENYGLSEICSWPRKLYLVWSSSSQTNFNFHRFESSLNCWSRKNHLITWGRPQTTLSLSHESYKIGIFYNTVSLFYWGDCYILVLVGEKCQTRLRDTSLTQLYSVCVFTY